MTSLGELRRSILETPFVRGLPRAMRERFAMTLLWVSEWRTAPVGEVVYIEGKRDENTGAFILSGSVRVAREGEEDEIVEAPNLLGEIMQFTARQARTATVTVLSESTVLTFHWDGLGRTAATVFSEEECRVIQSLIAQVAWGRCAELFDLAARRADSA